MLTLLPMLATITVEGVIWLLVYMVIIGAIFGLIYWLIGYAGIPDPWAKGAKVVLAIAAVIILIIILLNLAHGNTNLGVLSR